MNPISLGFEIAVNNYFHRITLQMTNKCMLYSSLLVSKSSYNLKPNLKGFEQVFHLNSG